MDLRTISDHELAARLHGMSELPVGDKAIIYEALARILDRMPPKESILVPVQCEDHEQ